MEEKETIVYSREIPTKLHRRMKARAALSGVSIYKWVEEAIREKVEREEEEEKLEREGK